MDPPLKNPYRTSFQQIQEQSFQESFINNELEHEHVQDTQETTRFVDHLPSVQPNNMREDTTFSMSSFFEFNREAESSVKSTQVSGIHEKYLFDDSSPLPRKHFFQSQHKAKTSVSSSIYGRKMKKNKSQRTLQEKCLNLNPLTEGTNSLQFDSRQLYDSISGRIDGGEEEKAAVFLQLGLKQPKALGKARASRDLQAILSFLEGGQLNADYVSDFLKLLQA